MLASPCMLSNAKIAQHSKKAHDLPPPRPNRLQVACVLFPRARMFGGIGMVGEDSWEDFGGEVEKKRKGKKRLEVHIYI